MTPDEYCQDKAARSGSSFYYSFRFLPEKRRLAITALYAFCREVDDVVDETHDEGVARTSLAWWRGQVERLYGDVFAQNTPMLSLCESLGFTRQQEQDSPGLLRIMLDLRQQHPDDEIEQAAEA